MFNGLIFDSFYLFLYRTVTNIAFDDVLPEDDAITIGSNSDDEEIENKPPLKRRRRSSGGEQFKMYESIAQSIKDNHSKKLDLMQQAIQSNKPQTELELYFMSICKTVEKLSALEQAKIKMQISNIVSQSELAHLQSSNATASMPGSTILTYDTYSSDSQSSNAYYSQDHSTYFHL